MRFEGSSNWVLYNVNSHLVHLSVHFQRVGGFLFGAFAPGYGQRQQGDSADMRDDLWIQTNHYQKNSLQTMHHYLVLSERSPIAKFLLILCSIRHKRWGRTNGSMPCPVDIILDYILFNGWLARHDLLGLWFDKVKVPSLLYPVSHSRQYA